MKIRTILFCAIACVMSIETNFYGQSCETFYSSNVQESDPTMPKDVTRIIEQITTLKREVALQKSLAEAACNQLDELKTALTAYLIAEEKLLDDYEAYRIGNYDPSLTEAAFEESRILLSQSWQAYTAAVHALNVVLSNVGMEDRLVPINKDYELIVKGALGV